MTQDYRVLASSRKFRTPNGKLSNYVIVETRYGGLEVRQVVEGRIHWLYRADSMAEAKATFNGPVGRIHKAGLFVDAR